MESYRQWTNTRRHNWQPIIPSHDLPSKEMESPSPSSAETLSDVEQGNIAIDQQPAASYNPTQPFEQGISDDSQDSMDPPASMDVHTGAQGRAVTYQHKRRNVQNAESTDPNPRLPQRRRNYTLTYLPTQHTPHALTHTHADSSQESSLESSRASLGDPWASLSSSHLTCDTD